MDKYSNKIKSANGHISEEFGKQARSNVKLINKFTESATDKINHPINTIKNTNAAHPIKATKALAKTVKNNGGLKATVVNNMSSIPARLRNVATVLNDKGYAEAINQFGFNTVAEVLQYVAPVELAVQPN